MQYKGKTMKEYDTQNDETPKITRIGDSKFHFGIWYKITNERALIPVGHCGDGWLMDYHEEPPTYYVGDYSREKFNSVKFVLSIHDRRGFFDQDKEPSYCVAVLCFADTRECGAETIVSLTVKDLDNIDKRFFDYAANVLKCSGAVVDVDLNTAEMKKVDGFIAGLQKYNETIKQIIQEV